jgi:hypothetical protein
MLKIGDRVTINHSKVKGITYSIRDYIITDKGEYKYLLLGGFFFTEKDLEEQKEG